MFYANNDFGEKEKKQKDNTIDNSGQESIPNIKAFEFK